jgi:hypothetical protein
MVFPDGRARLGLSDGAAEVALVLSLVTTDYDGLVPVEYYVDERRVKKRVLESDDWQVDLVDFAASRDCGPNPCEGYVDERGDLNVYAVPVDP